MAKLLLLFVICVGLLPVAVQAQENTEFIPGEVWKDTDGNPINAHGGGLLYHNGTYYWYGEYKKGKTVLFYGINQSDFFFWFGKVGVAVFVKGSSSNGNLIIR